ncbi:MAG: SpoIIE family protein phosphatase [Halothermotrichaceae bacterium]
MKIKVDIGIANVCKSGEEVCGDTTQVIEGKDSTTVILSDGLGSGIKASILSILSTQIASRMLRKNVDLKEVFLTIADTLPICKKRGIAYSTLSILKVNTDGQAHLIEYDNPSMILIRNNEMVSVKKIKRKIADKEVYEAFFELKLGDLLMMISDGVINAGVGGLFKLGLGRNRLLKNIFDRRISTQSVDEAARKIIGLTEACYLGKPGDDSTAVAVKPRKARSAVILTGPPAEKDIDEIVVKRFADYNNHTRIVCGGATGNMVARELGKEIETSMDYIDPSVPPAAVIEGVDLVTEGILTLNKCLGKLERVLSGANSYQTMRNTGNVKKFQTQLYSDTAATAGYFKDNVTNHAVYMDDVPNDAGDIKEDITGTAGKVKDNADSTDGATTLFRHILNSDSITILMGTAVNPAHEELMESLQLKPRPKVVGKMVNILRKHGKEVNIESF